MRRRDFVGMQSMLVMMMMRMLTTITTRMEEERVKDCGMLSHSSVEEQTTILEMMQVSRVDLLQAANTEMKRVKNYCIWPPNV
jgi:hypothetical protein